MNVKAEIFATLKSGDSEKWAEYLAAKKSSYEDGLNWRITHGHEEFCRLQRLWFWSFI